MMHPGSQWTGSQLAVTLQAVSGLVNCDVTCTAGLPTSMQATTVGSISKKGKISNLVALCWGSLYLVKSCD